MRVPKRNDDHHLAVEFSKENLKAYARGWPAIVCVGVLGLGILAYAVVLK